MTTRTKTDDTEREGKRDGTGKGQGETGNEREQREGDGVTPESNGGEARERWKRQSAQETEAVGPPRRRRDRNGEGGRKGGIQFNFLRNSLVFEIQPPKGCARG